MVQMETFNNLSEFFKVHPDPRTIDWPLVSNPLYTLGICLSYVYTVKVVGPKIMENRKPFELKWTLVIYNLLQVIFSTWLFYEIGMGGWFTGEYSLRCQPVDYSNRPSTIRMAHVSWWYFFSKFTEFLDTVFFILRKKFDHITTLHVIHHGIMPMSVWFGVKYTPGGHSTFFGLLNTFVHIVMYFYYMLTALGPQVQKYLWWKKYLTSLQMIQFVAIMVHAFQLLFIECDYPQAFAWWIGMHATLFLFLFKDFYDQAYKKKEARKIAAVNGKLNGHNSGNGVHKEHANGHAKENGTSYQNGVGHQNGNAKQNGAYFTNGSADLHQRIVQQM
ncbi:elongation of very long chain fatty acids protein AAEL008004-like [Cylas formicarius]|uniref:elongation of very long chain fatty acids protein AAEL008004-like n=1 Tax=Cylas formicarius TaxID=197179 RepID=UPI0029586AF8|nr:elongation of very long chain fatty acids protein AAEL008004-like [Cylas formicarius]XP_060528568.1 elongation of very long chain fatty acids protein AAEL008004-like [Cylas formicarius]